MHTAPRKFRGYRGLAALALFCVAGAGMALTTGDDAKTPKGDPYPLDVCPVSGEKLGEMGDPVVIKHEGREIRFCCKDCIKTFEKNADEYLAKIDAEIVKQQLPYYPLETCIVKTDEQLGGDMGDPVDLVYNNRLVRFCCKSCVRKFKKDPKEYLANLDKAVIEQQMAKYPLTHCVVKEEDALGDDAVNFVFANRLVRFCCKGCVKPFEKDPLAYMAKVDAAMAKDKE